MSKKNVLFINGIPDNRKVEIHTIQENGAIAWSTTGSTSVSTYMQNDMFDLSTVTFDTNPDQDILLNNIHAVFNEISDADTHKNTLSKVENFYKHVSEKVPFFNLPSNIMKTTREHTFQLLHDIDKLHIPKSVRIQPRSPKDIYDSIKNEHFEFPLIFRQAGIHGGERSILIEDNNEQFYAFPLDGQDYYLTQFVETAREGIYTKYHLIIIDGEVFIRHVIFSDKMIIHKRKFMEEHPEYYEKEASILRSFDKKLKPEIDSTIREIHDRLQLDYFGMDCIIDEQFNITIFEINASLTALKVNPDEEKSILRKKIKLIKNAIIKMITKKLSA